MIDPSNDSTTLIESDYGTMNAKWGGAVIVPMTNPASSSFNSDQVDTIIVFTPMNKRKVLALDPINYRTCLVGDDLGAEQYKYDGACLGADGAAYCAPVSALQALRIEYSGLPTDSLVQSMTSELSELQSLLQSGRQLNIQQIL